MDMSCWYYADGAGKGGGAQGCAQLFAIYAASLYLGMIILK